MDNAIDYAQGAAYQFANDMTFGAVDQVATSLSLCMDCNRSDAYYQGQQTGRVVSTVVSSSEAVLGTAAAAQGLAAMGPTAGGGLLCGAVTGGGCFVVAGVGLTAEGAMVIGGTAVAVHGVASIAYIRNNPVSGSGGRRPLTPNQMNQAIRRGNAPGGINRIDTPKIENELLHAHFDDGSALNIDGTWKHGGFDLTNGQMEWLRQNGWTLPK